MAPNRSGVNSPTEYICGNKVKNMSYEEYKYDREKLGKIVKHAKGMESANLTKRLN